MFSSYAPRVVDCPLSEFASPWKYHVLFTNLCLYASRSRCPEWCCCKQSNPAIDYRKRLQQREISLLCNTSFSFSFWSFERMQNSKPAAVLPHTPATELAQLSSLAKTATMQMLHNLQLHNLLEQTKCSCLGCPSPKKEVCMHDATVLLASSMKICQLPENNHATWLTVSVSVCRLICDQPLQETGHCIWPH